MIIEVGPLVAIATLGRPALIYACVLEATEGVDPTGSSSPQEGDQGDELLIGATGVLLPPGLEESFLPLAPDVVDLSPGEMIGCLSTGHNDPVYWLEQFFPGAQEEEGVIDRSNNHIWVFRGGEWVDVGDTPGEMVLESTPITPYTLIIDIDFATKSKFSGASTVYFDLEDTEILFSVRNTMRVASGAVMVQPSAISCPARLSKPDFYNLPATIDDSDYQTVLYTGDGATGRLLPSATLRSPRLAFDILGAWMFAAVASNYRTRFSTARTFVATPGPTASVSSDVTSLIRVQFQLNETGLPYRVLFIGGAFTNPSSYSTDAGTSLLQSSGSVSIQEYDNPQPSTPHKLLHGLSGEADLYIHKGFQNAPGASSSINSAVVFGPALDTATGTARSACRFSLYNEIESVAPVQNWPVMTYEQDGLRVDPSALSVPLAKGVFVAMKNSDGIAIGHYDGDGDAEWREIPTGFSPTYVYILYVGDIVNEGGSTVNGLTHSLFRAGSLSVTPAVDAYKGVSANRGIIESYAFTPALENGKLQVARLTGNGFQVKELGELSAEYVDDLLGYTSSSATRSMIQQQVRFNRQGSRYLYIAFGGARYGAVVRPSGLTAAGRGGGYQMLIGASSDQPGLVAALRFIRPLVVGLKPTILAAIGPLAPGLLGTPEIQTETTAITVRGINCAARLGRATVRAIEDDRTFGILSALDFELRNLL
jgi:hypothetical protein